MARSGDESSSPVNCLQTVFNPENVSRGGEIKQQGGQVPREDYGAQYTRTHSNVL